MDVKSTSKNIALVITGALGMTLALEGGFQNDPDDRGNYTTGVIGTGELKGTKYGISAMAYPDVDIKNLTKEQAVELYARDYVYKPKFDRIFTESIPVGTKTVDTGVNLGTHRSAVILQKSLNLLNSNEPRYVPIKEDGSIGPATLNAYATLKNKRGSVKSCELLLKTMDYYQMQHYVSLPHLRKYLIGWVDHRINNVPLSECETTQW